VATEKGHEPTLIIEISLPPKRAIGFQNLLEAEEGLAVMRCLGGDNRLQQLWTTPSQRDDLLAWLNTLPVCYGIEVLGERIWQR